MTFITHGFRVSVVSNVRERVRDFRITFALYVKKIFISWVCLCVTWNVFTMRQHFFSHQYVQPCLSKNPKYTFYTIKNSLTLAFNTPNSGALRFSIGHFGNSRYPIFHCKHETGEKHWHWSWRLHIFWRKW